MEGSLVDGAEGEDVVGSGEGCEAGVWVAGLSECEGQSSEDCELCGNVLLRERVWNGAFLDPLEANACIVI